MSFLSRLLNFFKGLQSKPEVVAVEKSVVKAAEPMVVAAVNAELSKVPAPAQPLVVAAEQSALDNLNKNL